MSLPKSDIDRAGVLRGLAALAGVALAGQTRAAVPRKPAAPTGVAVPRKMSAPEGADGGAYDFWFTRLRYDSGDWDLDQKMPSNIITSLIDYTNLRVDPKEHVLSLSDPRMLTAPFCYLTGHKLVEFNAAERRNFERYVRNGGFVFVDDCNHDIDGLFAKSFEKQMAAIFGPKALKPLPKNHPIFTRFFKFDGPPPTGLELNGWATIWCTITSRVSTSTAVSACSTATRTMAASGTTTGTTSVSSTKTTPSSGSTSSCMR